MAPTNMLQSITLTLTKNKITIGEYFYQSFVQLNTYQYNFGGPHDLLVRRHDGL
jgi:hypothetical protein